MAELGIPTEQGDREALSETSLALLHAPEFAELLRRSNRGPLLRREVMSEQYPAGYDPDMVWDALTAIRQAQAYYNPFLIYDEGVVKRECYLMCASLQSSVSRIGSLTQQGSYLDSIAQERSGARFVTESYIQEILSNLRYDGYPAYYEGVRAVLLDEREPMNPSEHFARNFHRLMVGLDRFADGPITPQVILALYERLCEGVPADMRPLVEPTYPVLTYGAELPPGQASLESLLQSECALTDNRLTDPALHDIMVSLIVNCFFWRYPPFERCNNLMGCIMSRLYLYQHGYPVFRYAAKAWLYDRWKAGDIDRTLVPYSFEESVVRTGRVADFTVLYDSLMKLMLRNVERMGEDLGARKRSDDDVLAAIEAVPYLTHRQVDVLRRAVLDPDAEFHIRDHQRTYRIAYSTARVDLVKLAEMGFLTEGTSGAYHAFYPAPQLREMLLGEAKQQ